MKVVHLSISSAGGAGAAARRTVDALRRWGISAELWTNDGVDAQRALRSPRRSMLRTRLDRLPLRRFPNREFYSVWSNGWLFSRIAPLIRDASPDLVHIHWIGDGFIDVDELVNMRVPLIWTLHDAWAFTGGCHYPGDCTRFKDACGCCPQLVSTEQNDLSARNLRHKRRAATAVAKWVTPSAWLGGLAAESGTVQHKDLRVIANGLDESIFTPANRDTMRTQLRLGTDELVVVAGAADLHEVRKGFGLLAKSAFEIRAGMDRDYTLVLFGRNSQSVPPIKGVNIRYIGPVANEAAMSDLLACSDLTLLPSLQDNLPNIAIEAQACGCPVIGFDAGGLREIIDPNITGSLASEKSASALAATTIDWINRVPERSKVSERCRQRFEERFTFGVHASNLMKLYEEVISAAHSGNARSPHQAP